MPQRLRLYDARVSRLPACIGVCIEDITQIAAAVNTSQRRLLVCKESGDEGWFGTWAEMEFTVDPLNPYLTTPREVARIEAMTVCNDIVPVQNQFYQYLQFGNGTLPRTCRPDGCRILQTYTQNNVPLFVDPPAAPFLIRAYMTNAADLNKRVLIAGLDSNGKPIFTQDGMNRVIGQFVALDGPFVTWPQQFNRIQAIQKDYTSGQVDLYSVDPTTGVETLILTMQPSEEVASYRRYYLNPMPQNCCNSSATTVGVKAMVKLDLIPARGDTDFLLLTNLEAIIEECQAVRYSEMDSPGAKAMAEDRHRQAVNFLNGEITHYVGSNTPSIEFAPFGTARLSRVFAGMR